MKIYNVPETFQMPDMHPYPIDNTPDFEYWFLENASPMDFPTDRIYLPILFTSYFKRNQYGKNKAAIDRLQSFVDSLPSEKKYFCIVQYDDGTLIDWKGKDVLIFGMSGKPENCIPIPLVCKPHRYRFDVERNIPLSFIGRITDPIRRKIVDWGGRRSDVYITDKPHTLEAYCKIMAQSKAVLCPRGYGASSFRISEAMQYGAMPMILTRGEDKIYNCPASCVWEYSILLANDLTAMLHYATRASQPPAGSYEQIYSFEAVKRLIYNSLWDTL